MISNSMASFIATINKFLNNMKSQKMIIQLQNEKDQRNRKKQNKK